MRVLKQNFDFSSKISNSNNNIFLLQVPGVILDHYPAKDNCKPCWRLNNTIIYQAPICTTDTNGKFTPEGLSACESFKNECPEFNKHKCLW